MAQVFAAPTPIESTLNRTLAFRTVAKMDLVGAVISVTRKVIFVGLFAYFVGKVVTFVGHFDRKEVDTIM